MKQKKWCASEALPCHDEHFTNCYYIFSSQNAKKWEVELQTLKNNNARLTTALQESTINVEEWKKQLASYKEENATFKKMVSVVGSTAGRVSTLGENLKIYAHALTH